MHHQGSGLKVPLCAQFNLPAAMSLPSQPFCVVIAVLGHEPFVTSQRVNETLIIPLSDCESIFSPLLIPDLNQRNL